MKPSPTDITRALKSIEHAELPEDHPRKLAQQAIEQFRSDAEKQQLPLVNLHDDKGAPVLNPDATLKWEPGHLGRKV